MQQLKDFVLKTKSTAIHENDALDEVILTFNFTINL